MRRIIVIALSCFFITLGSVPRDALGLSFSDLFNFEENRGPNTVGLGSGNLAVFGVEINPPGGLTVRAVQGGTTVSLPFLPFTLLPNLFSDFPPPMNFNAALNGSWQIQTSTDGGVTFVPGPSTNSIPLPQSIPLVNNLSVVGTGLIPIIKWDLPDLSGFDVDRIRLRIFDTTVIPNAFVSADQFFQTGNLGNNATMFQVPPNVLQFGHSYIFRVMLEDLEPVPGVANRFFIENRSSTFTQNAFAPVPEPSTLLLIGSGLAGLGSAAWRRRRRR